MKLSPSPLSNVLDLQLHDWSPCSFLSISVFSRRPQVWEKAYAWLDQPVPFYATAQPPCLGPKASSLECLVAIPSSGSHHPHLHVAVSITFNSVLTSVRHF